MESSFFRKFDFLGSYLILEIKMSLFEQCLMGLEDDIFCKRVSVPDPDSVLLLAKYIYTKPALSVHTDGLLEHLLDQFSDRCHCLRSLDDARNI
jgi:hypothetical protein